MVQKAVFILLFHVLVLRARILRAVAHGLTDNERVVRGRHHRLVLRGVRQHWPLVLRVVLLDVLLVRLLRQRYVVLVECLRTIAQHLRLNVRSILVVVGSLLLLLLILARGILVHAHLWL